MNITQDALAHVLNSLVFTKAFALSFHVVRFVEKRCAYMSTKTWAEHKDEMKQADRKEWLEVIAISFGMIAVGGLLAYLIA